MARQWEAGDDPAGGQQVHGRPAAGEQAGGQQAHGQQAGGQPAAGEQAGGQQAHGQQAGGQQAGGQQAGGQQAGGQPAAGEQAGGQQAHGQQAGGEQAGDQAGRVWAAMRALVEGQPTKQRLRDALDLGRGSGRVKSLIWLTEGPLSLSGLAEAIGVDAPYATLIVDSLEERGLVERQPDPADRRRKLVTLTPAGRDAVAEVLRIQLDPPPGFASLSAAELDTLEKLVWRIMTVSR